MTTTQGECPSPTGRWRVGVLQEWLLRPVRTPVALSLLALVWAGATVFSLVARAVMPERFYYDGLFIEAIALDRAAIEPDRAFALTGALYQALGLTLDPYLPAAFGALVAGLTVVVALVGRRDVALGAVALSALGLGLMAIFLAWYTKETFAIVAMVAAIVLLRWSRSLLVAVAPIALYGVLLRPYWLLVAALAVAFVVLERRRPLRWWRLAAITVAFLLAASLAYHVAFGAPLQEIRLAVNEGRSAEDTASIITAAFSGAGVVGDVLGSLLVLITLVLPVPLLLTGQSIHAMYAVAILGIWATFALTAWTLRRARVEVADSRRRSARRPAPDQQREHDRGVAIQCVYLLIAFLAVQAIFEPDFGSYVRHLSAVIPVMALLVCSSGWSQRDGRTVARDKVLEAGC